MTTEVLLFCTALARAHINLLRTSLAAPFSRMLGWKDRKLGIPTAVNIPIRLTTVISSPIENPRMSRRSLLDALKIINGIETANEDFPI